MPDLGGKSLVGEVGGMLGDLRKAVEGAKAGLMGAVTEFIQEVEGLKHVEAAVRSETKEIRDLKTSILGNAVGGEGQGEKG